MSTMTSEEAVEVTTEIIDGRIAKVLFRNASKLHALNGALLGSMEKQLTVLASQGVSVVILTSGLGEKVWSAGHDIDELAEDHDPIAWGKPLERLLRRVRTYPGVVIAMVSGSVWGGAVDLVMSCDLVVADMSARFAMTPANIGLPYSTSGLLRFVNNLPIHILKEMFFCARPLEVEQAEHFGLVNRLVQQEDLEALTLEMARGIASKAPLAITAVKEQLRILEDLVPVPVDAMERITELRRVACSGEDMREGLEAFVQRRAPLFRGR
ncbi:methylmalonyl-CoA decarboxylase [Paraburkholderia sp. CNPSo 3076]|uniref:methylmalonyl-CoA decarboxylase n=1 Tax=Paraburkholderia sp. CNPSo 3076 TaxID=2940936 RepID=UPI0022526585|nr:methylmalonyl-CoA decarboxylase [Paraburkholderia sp. CNPSo 3076]MCX5542145.1 methylmalonyl-CoA decarboxylase [Paraburkholderia sp. CNPSo 3076]